MIRRLSDSTAKLNVLTNDDKYCLITLLATTALSGKEAQIFRKMTIARDKGKPVVKQGRKAVSLMNLS